MHSDGLADLEAQIDAARAKYEDLDEAASHLEGLAPELKRFAEVTLPKRVAEASLALEEIERADDPSHRNRVDGDKLRVDRNFAYDGPSAKNGRALGEARAAVRKTLTELSSKLTTLREVHLVAADGAVREAQALRTRADAAKRELEKVSKTREDAVGRIAQQFDEIQRARERSEAAE